MVNEKIRHQGLSAKEIFFSRDQYTLENLQICDEEIAEEKMDIRKKENIYSAKSKAATPTHAKPAGAAKGHLVFLKKDGGKLERRDLYLVIEASEDSASICKLPAALSGNTPVQFQPHNINYSVKQTDIFLAPNQPVFVEEQQHQDPDLVLEQEDLVLEQEDLVLEQDVQRPRPPCTYNQTRTYPFERDQQEDDDFEDDQVDTEEDLGEIEDEQLMSDDTFDTEAGDTDHDDSHT